MGYNKSSHGGDAANPGPHRAAGGKGGNQVLCDTGPVDLWAFGFACVIPTNWPPNCLSHEKLGNYILSRASNIPYCWLQSPNLFKVIEV